MADTAVTLQNMQLVSANNKAELLSDWLAPSKQPHRSSWQIVRALCFIESMPSQRQDCQGPTTDNQTAEAGQSLVIFLSFFFTGQGRVANTATSQQS